MTRRDRGPEPVLNSADRRPDLVGQHESFVVTLKLDEPSFDRLTAMRRRYFPAALNRVPAHLTLLHRLDAPQVDRLLAKRLELLAEPPITLEFRGLRLMGQGVSIDVRSSGLLSVREAVVAIAGGDLTRQDQQGFRPHVTVQNKVTVEQAKTAMAQLSESFAPWRGLGRAILVWRYLGGPWGLEHELAFNNP